MTLSEIQDKLVELFIGRGIEEPKLEARHLLTEALGISSADLIQRGRDEISREFEAKIFAWGKRRAEGEPLAYLSGRKGFYKSDFLVGPGVLVPRPETELVVEEAMREIQGEDLLIADLGAGSGCIGLSLCLEWPQARLWAVDQSLVACAFVTKNAEQLGVMGQVSVVQSAVEDWKTDLIFNVVVANPPYIPQGDARVWKVVHRFEPHEALYSGIDGLDAIERWSSWAFSHLCVGGKFVCEFGAGQSAQVEAIIKAAGFIDISVARDLAGHERVISCRRGGA